MYNRPSNDNGRGRRPTLPSIRDLFSDELAMSTVSHDPHRVHSQVSDVEDRRNYPFGHELPMPIAHQSPRPLGVNHPAMSPPSGPYTGMPVYQGNPSKYYQIPYQQAPHMQGGTMHHTPTRPYQFGGAHPSMDYTQVASSGSHRSGPDSLPRLWNASSGNRGEDEERTGAGSRIANDFAAMTPQHALDDGGNTGKYECQYCGKGFTRPSSLRTHLNSHTGEKPFVCPVEGCGRSFSVLSNMRRHARVHPNLSLDSTDEMSGPSMEDYL